MLKLTEENLKNNLNKIPNLEGLIVQQYRPNTGLKISKPDYPRFWSGRVGHYNLVETIPELNYMLEPCVTSDYELPEKILKAIVLEHERIGNREERNVKKIPKDIVTFLNSCAIGIADMTHSVFPEAYISPLIGEVKLQGGYLTIYEDSAIDLMPKNSSGQAVT